MYKNNTQFVLGRGAIYSVFYGVVLSSFNY
jgi:hypothetical protein